ARVVVHGRDGPVADRTASSFGESVPPHHSRSRIHRAGGRRPFHPGRGTPGRLGSRSTLYRATRAEYQAAPCRLQRWAREAKVRSTASAAALEIVDDPGITSW